MTLAGIPTTTGYTYNAANQLTQEQITGGNTYTYTYDDNGNLTAKKQGVVNLLSYTWNQAGRLASAGNVSYAYNGDGDRVQQTVGGVATNYLLDVQPELTEVLSATTNETTPRTSSTGYSACTRARARRARGLGRCAMGERAHHHNNFAVARSTRSGLMCA